MPSTFTTSAGHRCIEVKITSPRFNRREVPLSLTMAYFPLTFLINLERRQDRREASSEALAAQGVPFEVFQATDGRLLPRRPKFFETPNHWAHALSFERAIKVASDRQLECVVLLEDDIVIHPQFHELLAKITLPNDWEIFYFGVHHVRPGRFVGSNLVRVTEGLETHAMAIHSSAYSLVLDSLYKEYAYGKQSDQRITELHRTRPCYASHPNLIWQSNSPTDLQYKTGTKYNPDGSQKLRQQTHEPLTP